MSPVVSTIAAGFTALEGIRVAIAAGPAGLGIPDLDSCERWFVQECEEFLGAAFADFLVYWSLDAAFRGPPTSADIVEALGLVFAALGRTTVALDRACSDIRADVIVCDSREDGLFAVLSLVDGAWVVSEPDDLPVARLMAIGGDL